MVLNNYRMACRGNGTMKSISNANIASSHQTIVCNNASGGFYSENNAAGYIDVGYGNTAEDANDYNLADSNSYGGTQVGALTWMSTSYINANPYLKRYTSTYLNSGSTDITVTELGVVAKSGSAQSNPAFTLLLARKVLETPVVVPAGSTVAFTYGIKA